MRFIIYILLLFIVSSCTIINKFSPKSNTSKEQIINEIDTNSLFLKNNLIIVRDEWGVPHIFGKSDSDAAFGLAYSNAQDDFKTIHDLLLRTRGKYSSVYGVGENKINASLDYLVGLLKIWNIIEKEYPNKVSEETKKLCQGYADGINYYLEMNPHIEQHIYPVVAQDIIAGFMYKTPFFFDLPIYLSALFTKKPEEIPDNFSIDDKINIITKGSNVFAVSPKITKNNETFLAINSHQPWNGDLAWYEAHIYSNEGFNISGGLFPGSPLILVGYNEHLGWGHTVNKPDILDIYELTINPKNENQYLFDGEWKEFEQFNVDILIKGAGQLGISHSEPAFWSIHGPVIKGKYATYAIRYSWENNINIIEQWYKMNKATDFEEFNDALSIMALPMFNTGYADKTGNIFYLYNAKLPRRNNKYDWAKVVPGDTSATLWGEYFEYNDLPKILNPKSGYIQNCNNGPLFSIDNYNTLFNPDIYIGIENTNTNRSMRSIELFGGYDKISYDNFKEIKFDLKYSDTSNIAKIRNKTLKLIQNKKNKKLKEAYEILYSWDLMTNMENVNATLPIVSFSKFIDVNYKSISDEMILNALDDGIKFLYKHHKTLKINWGDINKLIRGKTILPLSGGPDISRAIYGTKTKKGLLEGVAGDAYMALISWDKFGNINSESMHQFGSATLNSASDHFDDQANLFSKHKFKKTTLDINDIFDNAKSIHIIY